MQTHAEHQQNNAYFRALGRGVRVRDKSGGVRTDENTGQKISDKRGKPQFLRDEPENKGGAQASGQGKNQVDVVRHGDPLCLRYC